MLNKCGSWRCVPGDADLGFHCWAVVCTSIALYSPDLLQALPWSLVDPVLTIAPFKENPETVDSRESTGEVEGLLGIHQFWA